MKKFETKSKSSQDFAVNLESSAKKVRHRKKQLYNSILKQMEFYFGDANLSKDRFLGELIKNDPYVPLSTFLQFNKLRVLTDNIDDIAKALVKSDMLKLSEDELKVCRTTAVAPRPNIDECTIYVESLPPNTDHEWLKTIFSIFGNVSYVSIPKFKQNKQIKGFAFIEFEHPSYAIKCIEAFSEIGSKLQTGMDPQELCSITTFDDPEKSVVKSKLKLPAEVDTTGPGKNAEHAKECVESEKVHTKERKRKLSKSDQTTDDVKVKKAKRKLNVDKPLESHNSDNMESDTTESEDTKNKRQRKDSQKAVQFTLEEASEMDTEDNENDNEEDGGKKKRKRKKNIKKNKEDIFSVGLKVLSKKEWKKLRNTYLDLQRTKMQQLKKQLNINREYHNPGHYQQNFYGGQEKDKRITESNTQLDTTTLSFTPNVILGVKLLEPCVDIKGFKAAIKNTSQEVKYIDVSEGSMEAFIRFADPGAATCFQKLLNKTGAHNLASPMDSVELNQQISLVYLLTGTQEKDYWAKMAKDREDKRTKKIKVEKKGRDKLIAKVAKNSHIHFNDDD